MKEIIIYTNENCSYCKRIKEELEKNNIEFINKITNNNQEEWQNVISLTDMPTVPTIYYEENYFIPGRNFQNPQNLIDILKNFKKSNFSLEQQALEKIKTLNYNISVAFNRLDQLLRTIETKLNTEENEHKSTS